MQHPKVIYFLLNYLLIFIFLKKRIKFIMHAKTKFAKVDILQKKNYFKIMIMNCIMI